MLHLLHEQPLADPDDPGIYAVHEVRFISRIRQTEERSEFGQDVWQYRRNPWIVILSRERENVVNQREDLQEMAGRIAPAGLHTVLK
jgi:hypothetical protein